MSEQKAALVRCEDYDRGKVREALVRQFELLGGMEKFVSPGDSVLIKPNLISPKPPEVAAQTDPAVIVELARLLKDFGARPFVGDSPAWGNVYSCIKALRIDDELKHLGVEVRQLNGPVRRVIGKRNTEVKFSGVALDADVIINVPKFKTHCQLVATFAVKNMFGCVSGKQKAYFHFSRGGRASKFCRFLIDVFEEVGPALTIIDGVVAMDGHGPIGGRARKLGWLIAGSEPISLELVCARLAGMDANELPVVRTARKIGYGCCDEEKIEIVGDKLEAAEDFEQADLIPIRFSLLRVLQSRCKQLILLAKLKRGRVG